MQLRSWYFVFVLMLLNHPSSAAFLGGQLVPVTKGLVFQPAPTDHGRYAVS